MTGSCSCRLVPYYTAHWLVQLKSNSDYCVLDVTRPLILTLCVTTKKGSGAPPLASTLDLPLELEVRRASRR